MPDRVVIGDPEKAIVTLDSQNFAEVWSRNLLLILAAEKPAANIFPQEAAPAMATTPEPTFNTLQLNEYVDRLRAGDRQAADGLLRQVCRRLERLAHRMLKGFPGVKRWADTDDILQSALVRLLRSLEVIRPESTRDFFNLAAVQIRRELLDLARKFRGRLEPRLPLVADSGDESPPSPEVPDANSEDTDLDHWAAFHEQVDQLPIEEREVVGLTFYHGWTQPQIAELLGVDERTVRRRWRAACGKLSNALGGRLPEA
jgi:RNA polymerase sigma factor (sigma-70 family)